MKTDDVEMQTFVRDGLQRYYFEAKASITAFEARIKSQLTAQLAAMPASPMFPAGSRDRGKVIRAGTWSEGETMSIHARLPDNSEGYLELGFDWGTFEPGRPALYTAWPEGDSSVLRLADPTSPVQSHRKGYLFVPVSDGFQLEESARSLLAETVRALGEMKAVR